MKGTWRSLAAALLALALVAGTAGASRVGFSPAEAISLAGPLTVTAEMTTIRCNTTLRGTITRALVGVGTEESLGTISEATTSGCTGGAFRVLTPANIRIAQTLILRGETLVGVLLQLERTGVLIEAVQHCLYGTSFGVLVGIVEEEPGQITGTYEILRSPLGLIRNLGIAPCIATASLGGTGTLSPTQRVTYLP